MLKRTELAEVVNSTTPYKYHLHKVQIGSRGIVDLDSLSFIKSILNHQFFISLSICAMTESLKIWSTHIAYGLFVTHLHIGLLPTHTYYIIRSYCIATLLVSLHLVLDNYSHVYLESQSQFPMCHNTVCYGDMSDIV